MPQGVVARFTLTLAGVELDDEERARYDGHSRRMSGALSLLHRAGAVDRASARLHQQIARAAATPGSLGDAARTYQRSVRMRRQLLSGCAAKVEAVGSLADIVERSSGTVVFSQTIESSEAAAHALRLRHVRASAIHSGIDGSERRAHLDDLRTQRIAALCAPKILDEGVDMPAVDLGVVMSASTSRRQMIQRLGRIIRLKDDGSHARLVVLYAADSVEDPAHGAHEAFLGMVRSVAARETVLAPGWSPAEVEASMRLTSLPPLTPPTSGSDAEVRDTLSRVVGVVRPPAPPMSEAAGWVRGIALEVMGGVLATRKPLAPGSGVTGLIKEAILRELRVALPDIVDGEVLGHTTYGVTPNRVPTVGRSDEPVSLWIHRYYERDIVVEVSARYHARTADVLARCAAGGAEVVWVRWGRGPAQPVPGVAVVDLTDLDDPDRQSCMA